MKMNYVKGKNLITSDEYVTCPYCGEDSQQWRYLHWKHLKLAHEKTLADVRSEFPDHPTMTKSYDQDRLKGANKNKENKDKKKPAKCICGDWMGEVGIFETDRPYKECCKLKGIDNPDGRSNGQGEANRKKSLQEKYGENVINAAHIPGTTEKRRKTNNEKYGGTGFQVDSLKEKAIKTMIERGYFDED